MHQVKLREFMQKNMNDLPTKTFEQIENIIESESLTKTPTRKMADTYKKIRMHSRK
jgi:flagellar biosynthesis protein FliP